MKLFKKVISMMLVMVMLIGLVPTTASAEETKGTVNNNQVVANGTNGLGNLMSDALNQQSTEDANSEFVPGYNVVDLTVDGNKVIVKYDAIEAATLLVALYSEDGIKMVNSKNVIVNKDETSVVVEMDGEKLE